MHSSIIFFKIIFFFLIQITVPLDMLALAPPSLSFKIQETLVKIPHEKQNLAQTLGLPPIFNQAISQFNDQIIFQENESSFNFFCRKIKSYFLRQKESSLSLKDFSLENNQSAEQAIERIQQFSLLLNYFFFNERKSTDDLIQSGELSYKQITSLWTPLIESFQSQTISEKFLKNLQKKIIDSFLLLIQHSKKKSETRLALIKIVFIFFFHHNPHIQKVSKTIIEETTKNSSFCIPKNLIFQTDPYFFLKVYLEDITKNSNDTQLFNSDMRFLDKYIFFDCDFLEKNKILFKKMLVLVFQNYYDKKEMIPIQCIESILLMYQMTKKIKNMDQNFKILIHKISMFFIKSLIFQKNDFEDQYKQFFSNPLFHNIFKDALTKEEYNKDIEKHLTDKEKLLSLKEKLLSLPVDFLDFQKMKALPLLTIDLTQFNPKTDRCNKVQGSVETQVLLGEEKKYINANHVYNVDGSSNYIATQAPLNQINRRTVEDFWQMIFENKVTAIVMLTDLVENGNIKAERYWSDTNPVYLENYYIISLINIFEESDSIIREFTITHFISRKEHKVKHYWFKKWKDRNVPHLKTFKTFFNQVRTTISEQSHQDTKLTVVHCSCGVGRTGVFIAISHALDLLEKYRDVNNIVHKFGVSDFLYEILLKMRQSRNLLPYNRKQLQFTYDVIKDLINNRLLEVEHPSIKYLIPYEAMKEKINHLNGQKKVDLHA